MRRMKSVPPEVVKLVDERLLFLSFAIQNKFASPATESEIDEFICVSEWRNNIFIDRGTSHERKQRYAKPISTYIGKVRGS